MKNGVDFLARRLPDFCLVLFAAVATAGAFAGGIWAALGIGGALVMFAAVWCIEGRAPAPRADIACLALLMLCGSAVLNVQSSQPALSWRMSEQLATIFLPLCLFSNPDIQKRAASARLFVLLPYAAMAGALALGIELALQGPLLKMAHGPGAGLTRYNRGLSYLVILAFPIMASLGISKRRWRAALFVLILLIPASFTDSRSSQLALMVALLTVLAVHLAPVLARRALMAVPFIAAGWPFAARQLFLDYHDRIEKLPHSWSHRMEIWDYMCGHILERPLFGWGLGTSGRLPFAPPHAASYRYMLAPPPHPHNALIQLWVELGLPGLAVGIAFALLMLRRAGRLDRAIAPFAMGAWAAAFCLAMMAYDLWSDSLWAAFALTGLAFALLQRQINGLKA